MKSTAAAPPVRIREISEACGVTMRAVRFYEEKGLMKPARERLSHHRRFTRKDIDRLRLIITLKSLGLSVREIRGVLEAPGDGPYGLTAKLCAHIKKRLTEQKAHAEAALAQLRKVPLDFS